MSDQPSNEDEEKFNNLIEKVLINQRDFATNRKNQHTNRQNKLKDIIENFIQEQEKES